MIREYPIVRDEAQNIADAYARKSGTRINSFDRYTNVKHFEGAMENTWEPVWRMLGQKYGFKEKDAYLLIKRRKYIVYAEPKYVIW